MKVKLTYHHRINEVKHPAGTIIELPDTSARWLIARNRAESASPKPPPPAAKSASPTATKGS